MKEKLLAVLLLAAGSVFAQFSVGIRLGAPPAPRVVRVQPRSPGAGYVFVGGYWYPQNNRYQWHDGYWTRPVYAGATWVEPRYEGGSYFQGYWGGGRGEVGHDHKWDKDRSHNRDYNRQHDRD